MFLLIKALATNLGVEFADLANWRGGSGEISSRSEERACDISGFTDA